MASTPGVPFATTNSLSSPSFEDPLPPLDPPAQRHRRHHLAAYFRRISAVLRGKTSDLTRSPTSTSAPKEPHLGSPTLFTPSGHVNDQPKSSLPAEDEATVPQKRRKSSPHSSSLRTISSKRSSVWTSASCITTVSRQVARDERASFLFTKYGLGKQPATGTQIPQQPSPDQGDSATVLRIQKKPRLRMHVTCHECNTILGKSSTCTNCGHKRCRLCPREAPKGVRALIDRTKKDLESIPEPTNTERLSGLSLSHRTSNIAEQPRLPSTSRLPLHRQYILTAGHDLALLIPDPSSSDEEEEGPLPSLEDFFRTSCPFLPTRKRGRGLDDGGDEAAARTCGDCCYGPRPRVYRKVRQRRRRVCTLCRHVHSGRDEVCAECAMGRSEMSMVGV